MDHSASHTAILYFSRSPDAEASHKVVHRGSRKSNKRVLGLLVGHTLTQARRSGMDVIQVDETRQVGDSFGSRLSNAFQQLFDAGYEQVIAIGNDCPAIEGINWKALEEQVAEKKALLGPTPTGGTYLIGLHKDRFCREAFSRLPWQTSKLYSALKHLLQDDGGQPGILSPRMDLNNLADMRIYLARGTEAIQIILSSYYSDRPDSFFQVFPVESRLTSKQSSRAPPFPSFLRV